MESAVPVMNNVPAATHNHMNVEKIMVGKSYMPKANGTCNRIDHRQIASAVAATVMIK